MSPTLEHGTAVDGCGYHAPISYVDYLGMHGMVARLAKKSRHTSRVVVTTARPVLLAPLGFAFQVRNRENGVSVSASC